MNNKKLLGCKIIGDTGKKVEMSEKESKNFRNLNLFGLEEFKNLFENNKKQLLSKTKETSNLSENKNKKIENKNKNKNKNKKIEKNEEKIIKNKNEEKEIENDNLKLIDVYKILSLKCLNLQKVLLQIQKNQISSDNQFLNQLFVSNQELLEEIPSVIFFYYIFFYFYFILFLFYFIFSFFFFSFYFIFNFIYFNYFLFYISQMNE